MKKKWKKKLDVNYLMKNLNKVVLSKKWSNEFIIEQHQWILFPILKKMIIDWMMMLFYIFCIAYDIDIFFCSNEVRERGFTMIIDMRGSTWQIVKPILKVLQVWWLSFKTPRENIKDEMLLHYSQQWWETDLWI